MQNNGTLTHQCFDELAALAALGEASPLATRRRRRLLAEALQRGHVRLRQ
jgi:hypothetical protein